MQRTAFHPVGGQPITVPGGLQSEVCPRGDARDLPYQLSELQAVPPTVPRPLSPHPQSMTTPRRGELPPPPSIEQRECRDIVPLEETPAVG